VQKQSFGIGRLEMSKFAIESQVISPWSFY
jgi:hypothetical protein